MAKASMPAVLVIEPTVMSPLAAAVTIASHFAYPQAELIWVKG